MKFQGIMHAPINTTMLKSRRYSSDFRPGKNNNSDRRRVCGTSSVFIPLSSVVSCLSLRAISCLFREPRRVHCGWFCKNSLNTCFCFAESASEWIQARSRFDVPCHKHLTLCSASSATSAIQIRRDRLSMTFRIFSRAFLWLDEQTLKHWPHQSNTCVWVWSTAGISWYFTKAKQPFITFIHPYPAAQKAIPQGFLHAPENALVVFSFSLRPLRQVCGKGGREAFHANIQNRINVPGTCPVPHAACTGTVCISNVEQVKTEAPQHERPTRWWTTRTESISSARQPRRLSA